MTEEAEKLVETAEKTLGKAQADLEGLAKKGAEVAKKTARKGAADAKKTAKQAAETAVKVAQKALDDAKAGLDKLTKLPKRYYAYAAIAGAVVVAGVYAIGKAIKDSFSKPE